jgi:hypothetical protein
MRVIADRWCRSTILVYSGIFTFLVDAYPLYAASALAANSFARSSFGGIFPLFGSYSMFNFSFIASWHAGCKLIPRVTHGILAYRPRAAYHMLLLLLIS